MLAINLNTNIIPQLKLQDTVSKALQLLNEHRVSHLPVVSEEKYLGLIGEDELLDIENKKISIELLQDEFINVAVHESAHFLQAVNLCNQYQISIVPIINEERNLVGTISSQSLLKALGNFSGSHDIRGIIVLEMERSQFAISEISRIVESNEASIMHLNTTIQPESGLLTVTLHINKKELSVIVASFERYDYDVLYYFGEEKFENEIDTNYRHLMNYLDI